MKELLIYALPFLTVAAQLFGAGKEIEGERKAARTACPSPEEGRGKLSARLRGLEGQGDEGGSHDHEKLRWKTIEIDLAKFVDQKVTLRPEAHSNGWSMKFAYWHGISLE